jgi:hypothetical protein
MERDTQFVVTQYRVGLYRTVFEPYTLCVYIETTPNVDLDIISVDNRSYWLKRLWTFEGPKKSVYNGILTQLASWGIMSTGKFNHKSAYDLPDRHFDDISEIITILVNGLTFDRVTRSPKVVVKNNTKEPDVDELLSEGKLLTFSKNPSVVVLTSGNQSRNTPPTRINLSNGENSQKKTSPTMKRWR